MPGPKPSAQIIFSRISVELTRLRSLCETEQQHKVLSQYQSVLTQIMPLWTDKYLSLPTKRLSRSELDQQYLDAEKTAIANASPINRPGGKLT
jgi:hypothetical protein